MFSFAAERPLFVVTALVSCIDEENVGQEYFIVTD